MTDTPNTSYMTSEQLQQAFEDVIFRAADDFSPQVFGDAGLALALLGAAPNPDRIVSPQERALPVLSAALSGLAKVRRDNPASPLYRVSLDPAMDLPPGVDSLPSLERLAIWLMREGANPWLTDAEGNDGFEWAMRANSRTLVHMILSHPQCPTQEALEARTTNVSGRSLPWMHTLAYSNFLNLFDDMVDRSWSPVSRDRNGWLPAAWVHGVPQLQRVLDRHPEELDDKLSIELNSAWQRRKLKKLHSGHELKTQDLSQALTNQTKLTPEQEELLRLQKVVEQWLAFTPSKKNYRNIGVQWRGAKEGTHATEVALIIKYFDKRYESTARPSKGTWSPLAAAFWAAARGEEDKAAAMKGLLPTAIKIFDSQPQDVRQAWLNEEIMPGMSNQAFVLLMAGPHLDKEQRARFSLGLDETNVVQQRMDLATGALQALATRSSGDQWVRILRNTWFHQGKVENVYGYAMPAWMWKHMDTLAKIEMFRPDLETFEALSRHAIGKLSANDPAVVDMLPALVGLIGMDPYAIEGGVSYTYGDDRPKKVRESRVKLWKALEEYLELNPEHVRVLDPKNHPFKDYKAIIEKGELDLPDAMAWESMVRRRQLMELASETPAPPEAPRRPLRM